MRHVKSRGVVGSAPDWYPLVRAARFLGMPPWELMDKPATWVVWAVEADELEQELEMAKWQATNK